MPDRENPNLEAQKDGPLIVRGFEKLINAKGEEVPCDPEVWLCRCGGSSSKPFCDDTHQTNNYSSKRNSDKPLDQEYTYEGESIDVHDKRRICSHSGRCLMGEPKVFSTEERPWIKPDNAPADKVAKVVTTCPSGALSYTKDGRREDEYRDGPFLKVAKDGPYYTGGGMDLNADEDVAPPNKDRYAICRCGYSANKPFCDGNHIKAGFKDDGVWE